MPVEFLGIAATNNGSETTPRSGPAFDKEYTLRLAGRTRTTAGTGCCSPMAPDPRTRPGGRLHREPDGQAADPARPAPNVSYPTFAAKTFATLDQISEGRLTVHFITGGNDHEQGREGDTLTKDERYARTREYIRVVKKIWTTTSPSTTRAGTTASTTSSVMSSRSSSPARTCRSEVPRPPRTPPGAPRRTSTACGGSPWRGPPSRSRR